MATVAKKQAAKDEKRRPEFIARAKQDPDSDFWVSIGAAWRFKDADKEGYAVRLHTVPVQWTARFC